MPAVIVFKNTGKLFGTTLFDTLELAQGFIDATYEYEGGVEFLDEDELLVAIEMKETALLKRFFDHKYQIGEWIE